MRPHCLALFLVSLLLVSGSHSPAATFPAPNALTIMCWAKIVIPDVSTFQLTEDMTLLGNRKTGSWSDPAPTASISVRRREISSSPPKAPPRKSQGQIMNNEASPPHDLADRTKQFALRIIRIYSALPKSEEARVLG